MVWESIRFIIRFIAWFGFIPMLFFIGGKIFAIIIGFSSRPSALEMDELHFSYSNIILPFLLIGLFLGIIIYL